MELTELFGPLVSFQNGLDYDLEHEELSNLLKLNNMSIMDLRAAISPSCSNMFERCMWKGTQTRCDTLFQSVDTSYGECCSFNYYGTTKNNYPT